MGVKMGEDAQAEAKAVTAVNHGGFSLGSMQGVKMGEDAKIYLHTQRCRCRLGFRGRCEDRIKNGGGTTTCVCATRTQAQANLSGSIFTIFTL